MICFKKEECTHPKWIEWCKKSEEECLNIAEKNQWLWYTDWYDVGDILRYHYEQADTSENVTKKYGGYDRWDEKHQIETSNVFLGIDGCFHESNTPIEQWTVYNPCTNQECPYNQGEYANQDECGYFGSNERQYDCFNDLFASIQAFIDVCGIEDLDKFAKKFDIHQDIIGWFKYGEKYFKNKGDDKMSKPFFMALSEIDIEEDITVYWDGNIMYVNDETGHQATANTSLYQAYKFSVLINANFDYTATDQEVKELSEELLDLIDEDFYRINVWEYIDSISDDFKKLTGIQLDINDKRGIVCGMTDDDAYGILCGFGSATYISKLLWRYIKGDDKIKMHNDELLFKGIDNPIANELADKYLMSDNYDLMAFAKALHKAVKNSKYELIINGALWINFCKYEYVDKIVIDYYEVNIYHNEKIIGSIERENISTIEEQYVETGRITNIEDILEFDIKKVGNF